MVVVGGCWGALGVLGLAVGEGGRVKLLSSFTSISGGMTCNAKIDPLNAQRGKGDRVHFDVKHTREAPPSGELSCSSFSISIDANINKNTLLA